MDNLTISVYLLSSGMNENDVRMNMVGCSMYGSKWMTTLPHGGGFK